MNFINSIFSAIGNFFRGIFNLIASFFEAIKNLLVNFFKAINSFFAKPYPNNGLDINAILNAILVAVSSMAVIFIVNPFNFEDSSLVLKVGAAAFLISLVFSFVFSLIGSNKSETWNILKQCLMILVVLICVGIVCSFIEKGEIELKTRLIFVGLAFLPLLAFFGVNQAVANSKYVGIAESTSNTLKTASIINEKTKTIVLESKNTTQKLSLLPNQLIALENKGGSVEITWQNLFSVETTLFNDKLENFEAILAPYTQFCKCNKNMIVNVNAIKNIEGNAQGLKANVAKINQSIRIDVNKTAQLQSKIG